MYPDLKLVQHFDEFIKLELPKYKTLITGDAVLSVFNIKSNDNLDIIIHPEVFMDLCVDSRFELDTTDDKMLILKTGNIRIRDLYPLTVYTFDDLFTNSLDVNGYKFMNIIHYFVWKIKLGQGDDLQCLHDPINFPISDKQ